MNGTTAMTIRGTWIGSKSHVDFEHLVHGDMHWRVQAGALQRDASGSNLGVVHYSVEMDANVREDAMATCDLQSALLHEPLLIGAVDLARLLGVSTRTLWRLRSAGELPEPVRFGGTVRWRLEEVRKWIAEGCPIVRARENEGRRK